MIWQVYLFLGFLAMGTSGVAISDRLPLDVKLAATAAGFVLWTIWGFAGYNVEVVTDSGGTVENQYLPLVLLGLIAAAVMLGYAIWNIMSMFGMDPKRLLGVRM